jgi:lipopolysaccharide export system ATP-binding protein
MSDWLLSCQNLYLAKSGKVILNNVKCEVAKNSSLGLVGANGAGKSTLFKCIMGLEPLQQGEIVWENGKLSQQSVAQRRALGIAYLAQEHWLFQDLDVTSNLKAICELLGQPALEERCDELLETVGLQNHARQKVKSLSGGEKRRLEIARLLLEQPKLIMLDEPFAGLDPKAIRLLKDLIGKLHQQEISTLISDHQVTHLMDVCSNISLLHLGQNHLHCPVSEFMNHPLAKEVYL